MPKKNDKLCISVDFMILNAATVKDAYRLRFTIEILDTVMEYDAYSFIDCFSGITKYESYKRINLRVHSAQNGEHM